MPYFASLGYTRVLFFKHFLIDYKKRYRDIKYLYLFLDPLLFGVN